MHEIAFPQPVKDRIIARRGPFEIIDSLDPARTALRVVDMQKAFVDEGAPIEVPLARGIVPNINRLVRAARRVGVPVVWIKMTAWEKDGITSWPTFYTHFVSPEFKRVHLAALAEGAPLHEIAAGLDVQDRDLRVLKDRFSAFIQGASDIDAVLRGRGIDTIIIAGTLTNRCCESSARDAMMLGYTVLFVEDANATTTDEEHVAALVNVATAFGDVRRTEDVVALLERAGT